MNRENKKIRYEKGYYKTHPCTDSFTCRNCGWLVVSDGAGSAHRNHCPNCLCSLHLDVEPGDRESDCGSLMEPVAVWVRKNGEWAIIHRCRRCGKLDSNRVAADDNPVVLMSIAVRPLGRPPFDRTDGGAVREAALEPAGRSRRPRRSARAENRRQRRISLRYARMSLDFSLYM